MKDTTEIGEALEAKLLEVMESTPESFSAMERKVKRLVMWLGRLILQVWVIWLARGYAALTVRCPFCAGEARYVGKRWGQTHSVLGCIRYRRAYYVCACGRGHYPLDQQLGLRPNALSAELERLAGLVGVQVAFGKGSALFEALTLIGVSDQSIDKAAQAYGREVACQEAAWKQEASDGEALLRHKREGCPPPRLYGALDGTSVHTRGREGEDPWRELKVGVWFETESRPPRTPDGAWTIAAKNVTYYADIGDAQQFGALVWATGVQREAHLAPELIFLGDGAAWIWNLVSAHFPHAVQIVDWFHACAYIDPVAQVAVKDQAARDAWVAQVRAHLWEGHLDAVIAACAACVHPRREDDPAQKAVTYFTHNRHRMDYPAYRAKGYQIGSGTIESGAKQIGLQRMKVPGARWNLDSARLVAKARAAFLAGQWDDLAARRHHLPKAA